MAEEENIVRMDKWLWAVQDALVGSRCHQRRQGEN